MLDQNRSPGIWPALGQFIAAVTIVCFAIDVLEAIDGWSFYLTRLQLFEASAWTYAFYAVSSTAVGAAVLIVTAAVLAFKPKRISTWAPRVLSWLGQTIAAVWVVRSLLQWDTTVLPLTVPLSPTTKQVIAAVLAIGLGYRTLIRLRPDPVDLRFAPPWALVVALVAVPAMVYSLLPGKSLPPHPEAARASVRPNIILITVDTLGARHMSVFGYSRQTTPRLAEWAKRMTAFDHAYANCNFTTCSMQSLMTGTLPWTHRALQLPAEINQSIAMHGLLPTLKQQGYRTLAAATSPWASPNNLSAGQYTDVLRYALQQDSILPAALYDRSRVLRSLWLSPLSETISRGIEGIGMSLKLISPSGAFDPRDVFTLAQKLAQDQSERPVLLWVHSMGPHAPYAAAPPFLQFFDSSDFALTRLNSVPPSIFLASSDPDFPQRYIGRYDEAVAANDAAIGKFLDSLVEQGLYDDALIVITADHGESFGHGYGGHGGPGLYEDLIRIPLLIKLPGQHAGQRISTPAQQADVLATVRDVLGLPADSMAEGRSLLPAVRGVVGPETIYSMNFEQSFAAGPLANGTVAMIDWPWKYVHYFGKRRYSQMPVLEDALFDLDRDPDELSSQMQAHPERSRNMRTQIEAQLALHGNPLQ